MSRLKIEQRTKTTVTDIFRYGGKPCLANVLVWQTVDPIRLTEDAVDRVLIRSWSGYPHNKIGVIAKPILRSLGVMVLGELEGGAYHISKYGRPDLTSKSGRHIVECGSTDFHKLIWCLQEHRIFWWVGLLVRYWKWTKSVLEIRPPPEFGKVVIARFENAPKRRRLIGGRYITVPPP